MLLLWTVMLSARTAAQSGDTDLGTVPTLLCLSHISLFEGNNISCSLVSSSDSQEDDEDDDSESIEIITACELWNDRKKCVKAFGDTVSSKDLNPVSPITLTAESRRHLLKTKLDLRKIIKPKSPQVYNVTHTEDNALVHVQTPYRNDYLNEGNQRFQIQLWSEKTNLTQDMTSVSMNIGWSHLRRGTQYHVKVRAAPRGFFQGTWSEWSEAVSFRTPTGESTARNVFYLWSIVVVVVVVGWVAFMKNRILTYMCPSIPHPTTTLMQKCGPNNGPLLIYKPEEFSSLNVYSSVNTSSKLSCSAGPPQSKVQTPPEIQPLQQPDPTQGTSPGDHHSTQHEREDSYVTMSSFYQIKTGAGHMTFATSRSAT